MSISRNETHTIKRLTILPAMIVFALQHFCAFAEDEKTQSEVEPVAIDVEVKTVEAQPIVQIRFKAKRQEIGPRLGMAYGALNRHITKHGGEATMMPLSRYYGEEGDTLDMAAAIAVVEPVPSEGDVKSDQLPGGLVASTWHVGPYDKLQESYAALDAWLQKNGHEKGERTWEIYWTDPGAEPDPAKWRTEIVQQLKN